MFPALGASGCSGGHLQSQFSLGVGSIRGVDTRWCDVTQKLTARRVSVGTCTWPWHYCGAELAGKAPLASYLDTIQSCFIPTLLAVMLSAVLFCPSVKLVGGNKRKFFLTDAEMKCAPLWHCIFFFSWRRSGNEKQNSRSSGSSCVSQKRLSARSLATMERGAMTWDFKEIHICLWF